MNTEDKLKRIKQLSNENDLTDKAIEGLSAKVTLYEDHVAVGIPKSAINYVRKALEIFKADNNREFEMIVAGKEGARIESGVTEKDITGHV